MLIFICQEGRKLELSLIMVTWTCADVSVTEQPNKKDLLNFSKSLNSYWVRESNPYCKIENLEY